MSDTKLYFDRTSRTGKYTLNYIKDPIEKYDNKLKLISKFANKTDCLLDVGCGSGLFLQAVQRTIKIDKICGVDFSPEMLKKASFSRLSNDKMNLCEGDALRLPFKKNSFNWVNNEALLHHLISVTRKKSKNLARKAIKEMRDVLKPNGFLLLTELYYESYGATTLTSNIIFTFLSFFNKYGITPPLKETPKGLIVSFYTRSELVDIIQSLNGIIMDEQEEDWGMRIKEKAAFLHKRGKITYLIQFPDHLKNKYGKE